ncbi:MAG TPA: hypothetical protein DD706_14965 [Nitrospiraceae bacterium]|nr:hypothetical protein [Nitrospiraceae bacterium]
MKRKRQNRSPYFHMPFFGTLFLHHGVAFFRFLEETNKTGWALANVLSRLTLTQTRLSGKEHGLAFSLLSSHALS